MHSDIGLPFLIEYLNTWERNVSRMPHAIVVRYEYLLTKPIETLRRIVDLLDPTFSDTAVGDAVSFASFDNLRQLEAAGTFRRGGLQLQNRDDPDTFKVRRGKIGGYRDDFDVNQLAEMDALMASRLSPSLGYHPTGAPAEHGATAT